MNSGWFYWPNFIEQEKATQWLRDLRAETQWEQGSLRMYGKEIPFPRLMAWYGEEGAAYRFSGKTYQPQGLTPLLSVIKDSIETVIQKHPEFSKLLPGIGFNSVLLNWYRQGQDSMSWHADDEIELGSQPLIASLSLGAPRWFHIKPKERGSTEKDPFLYADAQGSRSKTNVFGLNSTLDLFGANVNESASEPQKILLEHGSLLLMFGNSQRDYVHALPKTKKPVSDRINLTFRTIFQVNK